VDGARMGVRPMEGFGDNGFKTSGPVTGGLGLVNLSVQRYSHKREG
jgi:hypothetical protein